MATLGSLVEKEEVQQPIVIERTHSTLNIGLPDVAQSIQKELKQRFSHYKICFRVLEKKKLNAPQVLVKAMDEVKLLAKDIRSYGDFSVFMDKLNAVAPPITPIMLLGISEDKRTQMLLKVKAIFMKQREEWSDKKQFSYVNVKDEIVDTHSVYAKMEENCGLWIKWVDRAIEDPWQNIPRIKTIKMNILGEARDYKIPNDTLRVHYRLEEVKSDTAKVLNIPPGRLSLRINLSFQLRNDSEKRLVRFPSVVTADNASMANPMDFVDFYIYEDNRSTLLEKMMK